jgi:type I restriction enzyme S subunit
MGRYGSTDAVFYLEQPFWPHNTSLFVTDFHGNLPRWCYYLLSSITKADHAGKSAVPGVDRKDLFQIVVAAPPAGEQLDIVRAIEAESQQLSCAVSAAEREISLLREYRTRLIADVVTGKLDVREAAARLPDEIDEPESLEEADALTNPEDGTADDPDIVPEEALP